MVTTEFNAKYHNYLPYGHYGLAIENEKVAEFLDSRFQEYIKDPDFKYYQIKTKFGYACFYADLPIEELNKVEEEINNILKII